MFNTEQTLLLLRLEALLYGTFFLPTRLLLTPALSRARARVCVSKPNGSSFVPQCIIYHGYTPTLQIKLLRGAGTVASGEY